jgi:hypothetical protein
MFSARFLFLENSELAKEAVFQVFPSFAPKIDEDDDYHGTATQLPDSSLLSYTSQVRYQESQNCLSLDFGRDSIFALGEIISRCLERGINFKAIPCSQIQSSAASGYSVPSVEGMITLESLKKCISVWWENDFPYHPEMGRYKWDSAFREQNPQLQWVNKLSK